VYTYIYIYIYILTLVLLFSSSETSIVRTVFYGEYTCRGVGADMAHRAPYAKKLSDAQALPYLKISFIDGQQWLKPYSDSDICMKQM
jgi:hypothetical protein